MAQRTGLEPATSAVTGRRANQLRYGALQQVRPIHLCRSHTRPAGTPNGIRTRVAAVKGRCPRPLDDGGLRGRRTGVRRREIVQAESAQHVKTKMGDPAHVTKKCCACAEFTGFHQQGDLPLKHDYDTYTRCPRPSLGRAHARRRRLPVRR